MEFRVGDRVMVRSGRAKGRTGTVNHVEQSPGKVCVTFMTPLRPNDRHPLPVTKKWYRNGALVILPGFQRQPVEKVDGE